MKDDKKERGMEWKMSERQKRMKRRSKEKVKWKSESKKKKYGMEGKAIVRRNEIHKNGRENT